MNKTSWLSAGLAAGLGCLLLAAAPLTAEVGALHKKAPSLTGDDLIDFIKFGSVVVKVCLYEQFELMIVQSGQIIGDLQGQSAAHLGALRRHGPSPGHRLTFAGVLSPTRTASPVAAA